MNALSQKQALNEAFKRFQRLPDWPLAETSEPGVQVTRRNSSGHLAENRVPGPRACKGVRPGRAVGGFEEWVDYEEDRE